MFIGKSGFFAGGRETAQKVSAQRLPPPDAWNGFARTLRNIVPELATQYYVLGSCRRCEPDADKDTDPMEFVRLSMALPSDQARLQMHAVLSAIAANHPTYIMFVSTTTPWRECPSIIQKYFPPGHPVSTYVFSYTCAFSTYSKKDVRVTNRDDDDEDPSANTKNV